MTISPAPTRGWRNVKLSSVLNRQARALPEAAHTAPPPDYTRPAAGERQRLNLNKPLGGSKAVIGGSASRHGAISTQQLWALQPCPQARTAAILG
ncbi:hypothetical protein LNP17_08555 [Klebsiella variicola subsp. variicola]|nr:hypothetical protein [Klebsiella variicola subsp. variicola]